MISAAIATALTMVAISPGLNCSDAPLGPDNSIKPVKARAMPRLGIRPGRRPSTSHCKSGTQGTYRAVMQADCLQAVTEHDRGANGNTGLEFRQRHIPKDFEGEQRNNGRRCGKTQTHEEHRAAGRQRMLH